MPIMMELGGTTPLDAAKSEAKKFQQTQFHILARFGSNVISFKNVKFYLPKSSPFSENLILMSWLLAGTAREEKIYFHFRANVDPRPGEFRRRKNTF